MSDSIPVNPRKRVVHPEGGEVRTKQSDRAGSDINGLVSRYVAQGSFPPRGQLRYGDFSSGADFTDLCGRVVEMEAFFRSLPTRVRKYCQNDPGLFLDLALDPARVGELVELGLVKEVADEIQEKASEGAAAGSTAPGGSAGEPA